MEVVVISMTQTNIKSEQTRQTVARWCPYPTANRVRRE